MKKETKEKVFITQYAYAIKHKVSPPLIYNRVKIGDLTLNEQGLIDAATPFTRMLKTGAKLKFKKVKL